MYTKSGSRRGRFGRAREQNCKQLHDGLVDDSVRSVPCTAMYCVCSGACLLACHQLSLADMNLLAFFGDDHAHCPRTPDRRLLDAPLLCRAAALPYVYVCHGPIECGLETDGGTEGGRPDAVAPPGCDPTKAPKDSPACVDDNFGVFVSPTGEDGATGKKAAPDKTIGKGVELAGSRGLARVYVCEGTYGESVEVTKPVSLCGGLACDWKTPGASPKWTGPKSDFALRIAGVAGSWIR